MKSLISVKARGGGSSSAYLSVPDIMFQMESRPSMPPVAIN